MKIYYCDAPAGAGKTYAIKKIAAEKILEGKNVLIVQPTKAVMEETASGWNGVHCEVFHSGKTDGSVIAKIVEHFKKPYPDPHVVLITWAAFEQLPYINRPTDWTLFIDEVPQILDYSCNRAPLSHKRITDHIETQTRGPTYGQVIVSDNGAIRKISEKGMQDEALKIFSPIAKRLISDNWETYVDLVQYHGLLDGNKQELRLYSVMLPKIFNGFSSVTIAGARFTETILYQMWTDRGVEFVEHAGLKEGLRYHDHDGGHQLTILYAFEGDWSKTFRDNNNKHVQNLFVDAIKKEMGNDCFIWMGNKDLDDDLFGKNNTRLPNKPHGLNLYQNDYDNFVSLSALNPRSEHYKFLEWQGLGSEQVKTDIYRHAVYQAAMRCSLRDPSNTNAKRIIVPDLKTANWLQSIFTGSTVRSLNIDPALLPRIKARGRIKKHASNNVRKIASLERRLLRRQQDVKSILEGGSIDVGLDSIDADSSCDVYPFKISNGYKTLDVTRGMRFYGSLWDHVGSKHSYQTITDMTQEQFISLLRQTAKNEYANKTENKLISPSLFATVSSLDTFRAKENIVCTNGVWLDFENGNLTPKAFAELFPKLRIVTFNTWRSTKEKPRWRAYIPTDRMITIDEYSLITKEILHHVVAQGYALKLLNSKKPYEKAHGIDLGKLGATSLFYLPCQANDRTASFFIDHKKGRKPLYIDEWIAYGNVNLQPDETPPKEPSEIKPEFQEEIDRWRREGVLPGAGDSEMYLLATRLSEKGLVGGELLAVLNQQAAFAHSPEDRRKQAQRIVQSMR